MKKFFLLFVFLCWGLGVKADFSLGEDAFKSQRYSEAFQQFLPLADQGNYRAQYYIAYLYLNGLGVNKNDEKGLAYLKESLKENYSLAQALMAFLYNQGIAVQMNKKKAIELYKKAADQGSTFALLNLGIAYYQGDGVVRNTAKAIEYLEKIPIEEEPRAGRYLGEIYLTSDTDEASRALGAYRSAAEAGDLESYMALGRMYLDGKGVPQDVNRTITYYTYAASQGYVQAQYAMGLLYANGTKVPRNVVLGHAWLSWAANQKYEPAVNALKQLQTEMTVSDTDKARKEFMNLQKNVMGKTEAPFKKEQEQLAAKQNEAHRHFVRRNR